MKQIQYSLLILFALLLGIDNRSCSADLKETVPVTSTFVSNTPFPATLTFSVGQRVTLSGHFYFVTQDSFNLSTPPPPATAWLADQDGNTVQLVPLPTLPSSYTANAQVTITGYIISAAQPGTSSQAPKFAVIHLDSIELTTSSAPASTQNIGH